MVAPLTALRRVEAVRAGRVLREAEEEEEKK
jgi:hypothetical protein